MLFRSEVHERSGVRFASYFAPPAEDRAHFVANHCGGNRIVHPPPEGLVSLSVQAFALVSSAIARLSHRRILLVISGLAERRSALINLPAKGRLAYRQIFGSVFRARLSAETRNDVTAIRKGLYQYFETILDSNRDPQQA